MAQWAHANLLDGVDFDLENFAPPMVAGSLTAQQTIQWLIDVSTAARNVLGSSGIISHAPQAPYFGPVNHSDSSIYWTGSPSLLSLAPPLFCFPPPPFLSLFRSFNALFFLPLFSDILPAWQKKVPLGVTPLCMKEPLMRLISSMSNSIIKEPHATSLTMAYSPVRQGMLVAPPH